MATNSRSRRSIIRDLRGIAGRRHVLTGSLGKAPYCRGFRSGNGNAVAVVRPGSLLELWQVLQVCVAADLAIVLQAANTGLTGGSTPLPEYDRDAIVINTLRIDRIVPILDSRQVVCLAGATLQNLETRLRAVGRLPHSVLGSSCIGASVVGGICNNSGGALVQRGPAYTELSLFARVSVDGELELVNSLGIGLGESPEEILARLDSATFTDEDVAVDDRHASARDYQARVRDTESPEPSRYNADPERLFESSGCAGKLAVFAVRLDTFPCSRSERTFFVSGNDPAVFTELRRRMLADLETLPVSAEYIHRDTLKLAESHGNDTVWLIDMLGTRRIPFLFRMRSRAEALASRLPGLPTTFVDYLLQLLCRLLPSRVPERVRRALADCEHHLILKTQDEGIEEALRLLESASTSAGLDYFACDQREAELVSLYRFAAAGAAIRFEACHRSEVSGVVALDIALPRNCRDWFETLPAELDSYFERKLYYGHFLCHVLHQDYVVRRGVDCEAAKTALLVELRRRGARYPAEHNHGHSYEAPPVVQDFYRRSDPTNSLNPGIGRMSRNRDYA